MSNVKTFVVCGDDHLCPNTRISIVVEGEPTKNMLETAIDFLTPNLQKQRQISIEDIKLTLPTDPLTEKVMVDFKQCMVSLINDMLRNSISFSQRLSDCGKYNLRIRYIPSGNYTHPLNDFTDVYEYCIGPISKIRNDLKTKSINELFIWCVNLGLTFTFPD
jgi:hypothetical protein